MTDVVVQRIDMAKTGIELDKAIADLCHINAVAGYTLASTFVHLNNLVLIFQRL
jgi:hypothetical protein